ncbi:acid phosphatase type 7 [Halyomorpha halys]|uniref:acid phosphatase type 7 n=1 Tax=Halyomorpha halys TaxID=286706 RepID=UPI0006D4D1BE|nr:acid phosphatase type 7-like [Halyomorpha halys]XP_014275553.1 acid phosphatase type 7-like [Halyomorpha halys]XP_014275554.1 acid phosphatase type 7-like [Halyomorpha halys]XP_014275555.1 acid phosphatase type 7-like [Halyomorpha halys]XP_014275556.1 acid phosphatase type 7-like [Halyomorpha halys]
MCLNAKIILACLLIQLVHSVVVKQSSAHTPEQIHISYGDEPTESMVITWTTTNSYPPPKVLFGTESPTETVEGKTTKFIDGGEESRVQYIHRATLIGLRPATKYVYKCGSEWGWSDQFSFRTANDSTNWSPKILLYGDMGNTNNQALPVLKNEVDQENVDAIIHVGDFAYNMDDDNGRVGDDFMRQIQPLAAYVPYMVCPGNHERAYNFSHYRMRFSMPGNTESLFYSFNLGPAHFISIDTEAYYYPEFGPWPLINQWNWLIEDLKEANKRENRQKRPWVIVYGHHPMYCSNLWYDDCSLLKTKTRVGIQNKTNNWYEYGLEEIFYNAGVDIEFWGHEHSYERLYPVYDYGVKKDAGKDPYTNPKAPIHITSGIAGSRYRYTYFSFFKPSWSAFRSTEYGFTQIHLHNKTHINVQQITANKEVIDDLWIVKNQDKVFGLDEDVK